MLDYPGEDPADERERETVDALAEHETYHYFRGDDRACEELRQHLELFCRGACIPSVTSLRLKGRGTQTPVEHCGTATGHMPLLSQPAASGDSASREAGGRIEEEAA